MPGRQGLRLDFRALRSLVARRLFAVFLACSLLPVGTFALLAFWQARSQLEADADRGLRAASKAAGMSILDRLLVAESEMAVLVDRFAGRVAPGWRESLDGGRVREIARWSEADVRRALDTAQQSALASGSTVLVAMPGEAPPARLALVRRTDAGGIWAATLDPDFVFEPRRRRLDERYWVRDARGALLFEAPEGGAQAVQVAGEASDLASGEATGFAFETAEGSELGATWPLFLRSRFHTPTWTVAFSRPRSEVYRPLREFETSFPLVALASLGIALALSLTQIRRSFVPIDRLTEATRAFSQGALDARVAIDTGDEFEQLGRIFNEMAADTGRRIRVLGAMNAVGRALSAELDSRALLDLVVRESIRVTDSRGAAVFLALDGRAAEPAACTVAGAGADDPERSVSDLDRVVVQRCLSRSATQSAAGLSDLPAPERVAWRRVEDQTGLSVGAQVAVPMRDGRGETIGALVLFRSTGDPVFGPEACDLAESLASQAATAITKNHLVDSFRALFEGVIELTVRAIDEKSAYTGDHCRKVPILTEIITEAACAAEHGPLKDFTLSEAERYELHIAAMLHDCGKVVTPVHVMDKATKLETIFDRIALVETRGEVVRRDLAAPTTGRTAEETARRLARLDDDLAFVRACNQGEESMSDQAAARLREIAGRYTYTDGNGEHHHLITGEELRNLLVVRGTLNTEERKVIEQHVVTTMDLLSELPFPPALRAVPEIAGSHHERVDGSGYPRRLTREQISLQGRILGLADVFEALTAKDRPYKPGRTLTETFQILDRMCAEGAIDPDLYQLFKQERVYLRYIAEHIDPEQVDGRFSAELEEFTAGF